MGNFDFLKNYILEDERVKLSPLKEGHIEALVNISKESSVWTYMTEKGNGLEKLTKYIRATVAQRRLGKEYPFLVFDKIKNQYAGTTRLYDYSADLKTIKLGHTWYGEQFRGTGINKHCKYLLLTFAFDQLGLERVGFGVHMDNKVSLHAMNSIGCIEEGKLRGILPQPNSIERADIILFSILKVEWNETIAAKLRSKLNSRNANT